VLSLGFGDFKALAWALELSSQERGMQRSPLLRRLHTVARARAVLVLLLAVAPVVVVGCASGHHQGEAALPAAASSPSSTPILSPTSTGTAGPRNTAGPVTTILPGPAVLHLLADLRSVPFRSPLPPHLRVRGVGTWTYIDAGHVGSGYVGSAQVLIRSSIEGETVAPIYDVFTAASHARARFRLAESNFSRYSPADGFRLLQLSPAVRAFCGRQAGPASTTTCWFNYKVINGNVTTTAPPVYSGDGPAVLQAMLSHLLALTG
jgi:hypothetical protein